MQFIIIIFIITIFLKIDSTIQILKRTSPLPVCSSLLQVGEEVV